MAVVERMLNADYTLAAEARGQRVLWYRRFGSYQGEWLIFACDDEMFYVYRGGYGSCSGCDHVEGTFHAGGEVAADSDEVQKFIAVYPSFLEMRREAAVRVVRANDGSLTPVLPANQRSWYVEGDDATIGRQLALAVLAETSEITAAEILEIDNMEARREAIERMGATWFRDTLGARLIDCEGDNGLWHFDREAPQEPFAFLYVKDGSSERRYVLRVDPRHASYHAARAASFGMTPEQFKPVRET